jgi:hypothetical protein
MALGKSRRKARQHNKTSKLGNAFIVNEGVRYDDAATAANQRNKAAGAAAGLQQFETQTFSENYETKLAGYRAAPDDQLYEKFESYRNTAIQEAEDQADYAAVQKAWKARLQEERFPSPVPMTSGPPNNAAGRRIAGQYSNEDLGVANYSPPLLEGETENSVGWQVRQIRGTEALRRIALTEAYSELVNGRKIETPMTNGAAQRYLNSISGEGFTVASGVRIINSEITFDRTKPVIGASVGGGPRPMLNWDRSDSQVVINEDVANSRVHWVADQNPVHVDEYSLDKIVTPKSDNGSESQLGWWG